MKNRILKSIGVSIAILSLFVFVGEVRAQSPEVKENLNETKESVDKLIEAKDEGSSLKLGLRIKTFKKVIDLSKSEAKNLKVQLLALDLESKKLKDWREVAVNRLDKAIDYYEGRKTYVNENEQNFDLEKIKSLAEKFKEWRKENYADIRQDVQNLLMVKEENGVVKTARERWEKIKKDIELLEKAGFETEKLKELLQKSKELIDKSEEKQQKAKKKFLKTIVVSNGSSTTSTTASSSVLEVPTTSTVKKAEPTTSTAATSSSKSMTGTTSSREIATTSASEKRATSSKKQSSSTKHQVKRMDRQESVKSLVRSSLSDTKEAYQVFIKMSNFVRKLLK